MDLQSRKVSASSGSEPCEEVLNPISSSFLSKNGTIFEGELLWLLVLYTTAAVCVEMPWCQYVGLGQLVGVQCLHCRSWGLNSGHPDLQAANIFACWTVLPVHVPCFNYIKNIFLNWIWWPMHVIPAIGKLRQVDCCAKFEDCLEYRVNSRTVRLL